MRVFVFEVGWTSTETGIGERYLLRYSRFFCSSQHYFLIDRFLASQFSLQARLPTAVVLVCAMAPVYSSSPKIRCGYKHGCSFHGLRKNLNKHMTRFHKGQTIRLKNAGLAAGGYW